MNFGDERIPLRFWNMVTPCPMSGCWFWTGSTATNGGYGRVRIDGTKHVAHRVPFAVEHGAVQVGFTLDHKCRQRTCVNPAHLEAVTHRVNVLRGTSPIADQARATHCKHGHPLSGENLKLFERWPGRFQRCCRECNRRHVRGRNRRLYDEQRTKKIEVGEYFAAPQLKAVNE